MNQKTEYTYQHPAKLLTVRIRSVIATRIIYEVEETLHRKQRLVKVA